uniref:Uncharacterized protein n=1 Tax=Gadus morhua TaxID=8049 RepID=A0A8C5AJL5_GADMO
MACLLFLFIVLPCLSLSLSEYASRPLSRVHPCDGALPTRSHRYTGFGPQYLNMATNRSDSERRVPLRTSDYMHFTFPWILRTILPSASPKFKTCTSIRLPAYSLPTTSIISNGCKIPYRTFSMM